MTARFQQVRADLDAQVQQRSERLFRGMAGHRLLPSFERGSYEMPPRLARNEAAIDRCGHHEIRAFEIVTRIGEFDAIDTPRRRATKPGKQS